MKIKKKNHLIHEVALVGRKTDENHIVIVLLLFTLATFYPKVRKSLCLSEYNNYEQIHIMIVKNYQKSLENVRSVTKLP